MMGRRIPDGIEMDWEGEDDGISHAQPSQNGHHTPQRPSDITGSESVQRQDGPIQDPLHMEHRGVETGYQTHIPMGPMGDTPEEPKGFSWKSLIPLGLAAAGIWAVMKMNKGGDDGEDY